VALSENASRTRYTIKIKLKLKKWVEYMHTYTQQHRQTDYV